MLHHLSRYIKRMQQAILILCFLGLSSALEPGDVCQGKTNVEWIQNPTECQSFYMCLDGQIVKYVCPSGQVWNSAQKLCVKEGSNLDECSRRQAPQQPVTPRPVAQQQMTTALSMSDSVCNEGKVRSSHHSNCAQYYDCAAKRMGGRAEPQLMECPYPLLYDENIGNCQFPKKVECGRKYSPKDPCEYLQNQCLSAQCVPCHLRFPSCRGKPNGLHPWTGKEWTPYYIVCDHERVVFTDMCELDDEGRRKLFNPNEKFCYKRIIIPFIH